jgi:hypothetical protein
MRPGLLVADGSALGVIRLAEGVRMCWSRYLPRRTRTARPTLAATPVASSQNWETEPALRPESDRSAQPGHGLPQWGTVMGPSRLSYQVASPANDDRQQKLRSPVCFLTLDCSRSGARPQAGVSCGYAGTARLSRACSPASHSARPRSSYHARGPYTGGMTTAAPHLCTRVSTAFVARVPAQR